MAKIAEHFGANIAAMWGDLRGVSVAHPLHCGYFRGPVMDLDPDHIVAVGVRHGGSGKPTDFDVFKNAKKVVAIGPDVEIFENIPGLGLAIMADEARTIERLAELVRSEYEPAKYDGRRNRAYENARRLREERRAALQPAAEIPGYVRPLALLDAVDAGLEKMGGGLITTEQFAMPLEDVNEKPDGGSNIYIRPAGGSEGYGMGAPLGAKLAAPDRPVVGIVGDGSVYYSDSAFWTAAHHEIPVLYVIPNNGAYGIVAGAFAGAGGVMKDTGGCAGVVLGGADIVQLSGAFWVEGGKLTDESNIVAAVAESVQTSQGGGGRVGWCRRFGGDAPRQHGLQSLGQRSDPSARRGSFGIDADQRVPAPSLARRVVAPIGERNIRNSRIGQTPGKRRRRLHRGARRCQGPRVPGTERRAHPVVPPRAQSRGTDRQGTVHALARRRRARVTA